MKRENVIPVFFASDYNYLKYTTVCMKSLIENASKDYFYHLYILCGSMPEERKQLAYNLKQENVDISFVEMDEYMKSASTKLPIRDYYSCTTYYRLYIAEMFPELEKVIYLDSDMVVLGDIAELYHNHLGDRYAAVVRDQVVVQEGIFSDYAEQVLGIDKFKYFNAGMMLINTKAFREKKLLNKFMSFLDEYTFVVAQDQDYLNLLLKDHLLWLDAAWNMEVFGTFPCEESEMKIIHYNLAAKPWHYKDCRLAEYFWDYAKKTECYEEILEGLNNYTDEQRRRDDLAGENLVNLAISEIHKEDNYNNRILRKSGRNPDRLAILEKIKQYERQGRFVEDVEEDPPAPELKPEDIDYLPKGIKNRIRTRYAFKIAHWFVNTLIKKKQLIIRDFDGIENWKNLKSGAVITCNHFNAFDSFAMHLTYEESKHRRRRFYRVIREGNYTGFPGFYGFLMRNCYTLPLSSNFKTMEKFMKAVDTVLQKGHFLLVYPEQSMWWNYRKPKPLQKGAFTFAARNNVPVLPCFITMKDSQYIDGDGFPVQEYTVHILEPIYPDPKLNRGQNTKMMMEKNYKMWKETYEKVYKMPLEYTCERNS